MPKTTLRLPVGKYSSGGKSQLAAAAEPPIARPTIASDRQRARSRYLAERAVLPSSTSGAGAASARIRALRSRAEKLGMTRIDTISETKTEVEMAMATSRSSSPTSSCQLMMGKKTAAVVQVEAMMAPQTSLVARNEAVAIS